MSFHKKRTAVLLSFYLIVSIAILGFNIDTKFKSVKDILLYVIVSPYSKMQFAAGAAGNFGSNTRSLS